MAVFAMPDKPIASAAPRRYPLRIPVFSCLKKLTKSVLALDFLDRQPADPRQRPTAVGDGDRDHDLVGARRIVDLHFHAVEMATHESCVLVAERDIERRARPAALLRRRDQRRALAQHLAYRRAHLWMKDRGGMFELAVLTDRGGLTVTMRAGAVDAERGDRLLRQQLA